MTVNAGGKLESVSIGGREWLSPTSQMGRPLAELADTAPVVMTFTLRNNADLRRLRWRMRHAAIRARRRAPHPNRLGAILKAKIRAAMRPFMRAVITDENREAIKAALGAAATDTLAMFGVAGFTPTVIVPDPPPSGLEIELQFGFMQGDDAVHTRKDSHAGGGENDV